jgi:CBS domain containing-hemolysin-like protein
MATKMMSGKGIFSKVKDILSIKDISRLEKEIQAIIDEGEESGLIDPQSGEMIQSILEFRDTIVREVMIPRTEIISAGSDATIDEILDLITKHGHTRMPIYENNVDNILGILNVKDLIKFWSRPISAHDIVSALRAPYYIPETKKTHLLLHELKQKKHHMAIVIDEYGGTSGLVTLEDLIEEIVGEIHDEYDTTRANIVELSDGVILADGKVEIEVIEDYFKVEFQRGEFETLGGLILNAIKRIPITGEVIHVGNFEMIIDSADERSIRKVRIRKSDSNERGESSD